VRLVLPVVILRIQAVAVDTPSILDQGASLTSMQGTQKEDRPWSTSLFPGVYSWLMSVATEHPERLEQTQVDSRAGAAWLIVFLLEISLISILLIY
jgi:hypothetical protein